MTQSNQNPDKQPDHQELHPEIEHWLKALQKADDTFYNLMSIELWAITQTMDDMAPGFWSQYMQTRQEVMQQYLQEKRNKNTESLEENNLSHNSNPLRHSPLWQSEQIDNLETKVEQISIYSKYLDSEWVTDINNSSESLVNELELPEDINNNITTENNNLPIAKDSQIKPKYISKSIGINDSIENNLNTTVSITPLPHLGRQPVIKQIKSSPELPEEESLNSVAIACCLTNHFLVAWPDKQAKISWVLKRLDAITLTAGQSIICLLGFQFNKMNFSIGIQLVKRLRSYEGLNAVIVGGIKGLSGSKSDTNISEVAVQLTHRGTEPCTLQAGQPFCYLLAHPNPQKKSVDNIDPSSLEPKSMANYHIS